MKLTAEKRVELILDEIEYINCVEAHVQAAGKIAGKKIYILARDSFKEINDIVKDFVKTLDFLEKVKKNKRVLVVMFDLMSDRKDPSKSVFPPDPAHFLLDEKGVGKWYNIMAKLSKDIPIIGLVFDRLGASGTFPIMMCDLIAMTEKAGMSIGREDVVNKILGEKVSYEDLGGAEMHEKISGSIHYVGKTEDDIINWAKKCVKHINKFDKNEGKNYNYSFLGDIEKIIPKNPSTVLDMDKLITSIVDDNSFIEMKKNYAREIITGFATFKGISAGIIANRSAVKSGLFFPETCYKSSEFIKICEKFYLPIIFLVDSCGFMVGKDVEQSGIIKAGAHLFSTIANSVSPKLSIVVRRAYTAGVYAMGGGHISDSKFVALPSAIISIYSQSVGAMLTKSEDEKKRFEEMMRSARSPKQLLEKGYIDDIWDFNNIREEIINFLKQ